MPLELTTRKEEVILSVDLGKYDMDSRILCVSYHDKTEGDVDLRIYLDREEVASLIFMLQQ